MKINPRAELVFLGILWGISYLLIAVSLRYFSPATVVFIRLLAGALTLAIAVAASGEFKLERAELVKFFKYMPLQALISSTLPFLFISWGETRTSVATAGMLNAATPLFTFVFARIFISRERDGALKVLGLVLGVVGVALILHPWSASNDASELVGALVVLLASALYGYGFVYTRKYLREGFGSAKLMALFQLSFACLLSIPFLAFFPPPARHTVSFDGAISAVLVLGVVQTGLATLMYHRLVRQLGATASSVVTYVIPLVAVAAGVIFLGERLSPSFIAGALVVLVSVFLVARKQKRITPGLGATTF